MCLEGGNFDSCDHLPLLALRKVRNDKGALNQLCIWMQVWHHDSIVAMWLEASVNLLRIESHDQIPWYCWWSRQWRSIQLEAWVDVKLLHSTKCMNNKTVYWLSGCQYYYEISQRLVGFVQTKVCVNDSKVHVLLKEGLFWKVDQTIIFNNFLPNLKQYLAMF